MRRKPTKEDLLWEEKVVSPYQIGQSVTSLKRREPLVKIGFYAGDFQELTPVDCVFLRRCRTECDLFVIGLQTDYAMRMSDKTVRHSTDERAFRLGSMVYTNFICLYDEETCNLCIDKIQPDFIFYGRTQTDKEQYDQILQKDKLVLVDYPWREERAGGKFFQL